MVVIHGGYQFTVFLFRRLDDLCQLGRFPNSLSHNISTSSEHMFDLF